MPNVSVIGSPPPRELFTHLQAADYAYDANETYDNYQASDRKPGEVPAAIIVHGTDAALETSEALLQLLNTNSILLLFSPSIALLQALKIATKTIIDLPRLELADSVPLIVYKFRGIDRFSFVSGFSLKPIDPSSIQAPDGLHHSAPNKPELRDINPLQFSVELIGRCISQGSDPETLHQLKMDTLNPSRVRFCDNNIINLQGPSGGFSVHVYTYATEARPDELDFPENDGVVYTLFRFFGTSYFETTDLIQMYNPDGYMICEREHPVKEDKRDGDDYYYTIDFSINITLFDLDGGAPFSYEIAYTEPYILENVFQRFEPAGTSFSKLALIGDRFDKVYQVPVRSITLWRSEALVLTNFRGILGPAGGLNALISQTLTALACPAVFGIVFVVNPGFLTHYFVQSSKTCKEAQGNLDKAQAKLDGVKRPTKFPGRSFVRLQEIRDSYL